jgi:hypothetical protein
VRSLRFKTTWDIEKSEEAFQILIYVFYYRHIANKQHEF